MKPVKLPLSAIVRAPGLLHMWYTSKELVDELTDLRTDNSGGLPIKQWITYGLPHRRDTRGHLWFDGQAVAEWIAQQRQKPVKQKFAENETHCFHCRGARVFENIAIHSHRGKQIIYRGTCVSCGKLVYKAGTKQAAVKKSNFEANLD